MFRYIIMKVTYNDRNVRDRGKFQRREEGTDIRINTFDTNTPEIALSSIIETTSFSVIQIKKSFIKISC